jgi:hypothetical protein
MIGWHTALYYFLLNIFLSFKLKGDLTRFRDRVSFELPVRALQTLSYKPSAPPWGVPYRRLNLSCWRRIAPS